MAREVSAATAKAHLAELVAEVEHGGERVLIQRRGKASAALVRVDDLELLERDEAMSRRPRGALALVGAWEDVGDRKIDALVRSIYKERSKDRGRRVELEG